jgi:hypothetical protein
MLFGNVQSRLDGLQIASSSSIPISDNLALPRLSASAFNDLSPTSGWAALGSFSA